MHGIHTEVMPQHIWNSPFHVLGHHFSVCCSVGHYVHLSRKTPAQTRKMIVSAKIAKLLSNPCTNIIKGLWEKNYGKKKKIIFEILSKI